MFNVFLDALLPVFAVIAAGYVFGRTGLFSFGYASATPGNVIRKTANEWPKCRGLDKEIA